MNVQFLSPNPIVSTAANRKGRKSFSARMILLLSAFRANIFQGRFRRHLVCVYMYVAFKSLTIEIIS